MLGSGGGVWPRPLSPPLGESSWRPARGLIVLLTLREPVRGMSLPAGSVPVAAPSRSRFWADLGSLSKRRTLLLIALAGGFQSMVTYGVANWLPAFFMRVHDMTVADTGASLAVINGLLAGIGAIVGGVLMVEAGASKFVVLPIVGGSDAYLNWIRESTAG